MTTENRYHIRMTSPTLASLKAIGIGTGDEPWPELRITMQGEVTLEQFHQVFGPEQNINDMMCNETDDLDGYTIHVFLSDVLACEEDHKSHQDVLVNAMLKCQGMDELDHPEMAQWPGDDPKGQGLREPLSPGRCLPAELRRRRNETRGTRLRRDSEQCSGQRLHPGGLPPPPRGVASPSTTCPPGSRKALPATPNRRRAGTTPRPPAGMPQKAPESPSDALITSAAPKGHPATETALNRLSEDFPSQGQRHRRVHQPG